MKKIIKNLTIISGCAIMLIFSLIIYGDLTIPDEADKLGGETCLPGLYTVSVQTEQNHNNRKRATADASESQIKLLGSIPVKTVSASQTERKYLIPGGELVGLRLKTDGVLIVGTESFETQHGEVNPALDAGIEVGDTLKTIDDTEISTNAQLAEIIAASDGEPLEAEIIRDGNIIELTITPEISAATGLYKCGIWIRDSTGGIGTLTYLDIENATFGTLGHGIYDTDTGTLLPTQDGEISSATLSGIRKGISGTAGELKGCINTDVFGDILTNNENGIYGTISIANIDSEPVPIAYDYEIKTGEAQIICTIQGSEKKYYDIEIEKISKNNDSRNMVIRITDEKLLELTGGIVQGMSGSPIIQDGKIVGAVTHVFVNEPTKGYGITIENMLASSE